MYIVNLLISIHNLDKIKTLFNYYCTALIGCYDASELVKELEIVWNGTRWLSRTFNFCNSIAIRRVRCFCFCYFILWKKNHFQRWRLVQLNLIRVRLSIHSLISIHLFESMQFAAPILNKPAASAILMAGILLVSTVMRDRDGPCELPSFCCCFMSSYTIRYEIRWPELAAVIGHWVKVSGWTRAPSQPMQQTQQSSYGIIHSTFAVRAMRRSLKHAMTLFRLYDTEGFKVVLAFL